MVYKAKLERHHINYDPPEWKVELTSQMHRVVSRIQNTRATEEQYARLTNFMHSVASEWSRMRRELDSGGVDCRVKKKGGARRSFGAACRGEITSAK